MAHEQTYEFATDAKPKEYMVYPQYFRTYYEIHLTHIDYLYVTYTREWSGLRKRRRKAPKHHGTGRANNVLELNIPLATIGTWEPYKTVTVREVADQLDFPLLARDPKEITIEPVKRRTPHVVPVLRPSLYHLSNAAFPLKWVKIKGPWTEDDLKAAEMEEMNSERGVWFFQHGPGRNA